MTIKPIEASKPMASIKLKTKDHKQIQSAATDNNH